MKREEQTIRINQTVPAKRRASGGKDKTDEAEERATGKGGMQDAVAASSGTGEKNEA